MPDGFGHIAERKEHISLCTLYPFQSFCFFLTEMLLSFFRWNKIYYYYLYSWIFTIDPGSFNNLISARFGIFYAYFCMPFYLVFLF